MHAPVVTRFLTYDVRLYKACAAYCERIMVLLEMVEGAQPHYGNSKSLNHGSGTRERSGITHTPVVLCTGEDLAHETLVPDWRFAA
ncbi:MAG: hypothetical protein JO091_09545 [Acidobacteriaceae bacterium]|nr:hypothetical protein [Acidobacteriaceae bacterium]